MIKKPFSEDVDIFDGAISTENPYSEDMQSWLLEKEDKDSDKES